MDISKPYAVKGVFPIFVLDRDKAESAFSLIGTTAKAKVAVRIGGGCKGMNNDDKVDMLDFFSKAFSGYCGLVWSGGTRQVTNEGAIDPMVTEVPGLIMEQNPDCVALGTAPRTDILRLVDDSRLVLDNYGTAPNVSQRSLLIVQDGADGKLGWNGDVDYYIATMEKWRDFAGFQALGLVTWNGGPVTHEEIEKISQREWPVFLVKGSGRVTDETINKIMANDESLPKHLLGEHVVIVSKDDPDGLAKALAEKGFFPTE